MTTLRRVRIRTVLIQKISLEILVGEATSRTEKNTNSVLVVKRIFQENKEAETSFCETGTNYSHAYARKRREVSHG